MEKKWQAKCETFGRRAAAGHLSGGQLPETSHRDAGRNAESGGLFASKPNQATTGADEPEVAGAAAPPPLPPPCAVDLKAAAWKSGGAEPSAEPAAKKRDVVHADSPSAAEVIHQRPERGSNTIDRRPSAESSRVRIGSVGLSARHGFAKL